MEVLEISIKVEMTDARADLEAKIALCHRLMLGVTDQRLFFELTVYLRELEQRAADTATPEWRLISTKR